MKVYMISEVTGLKSKAVGAGMWAVIFLMLGWFNMSSGIGTDDMFWAAFTKNSFRVLATEIWFDMILSFSESMSWYKFGFTATKPHNHDNDVTLKGTVSEAIRGCKQ